MVEVPDLVIIPSANGAPAVGRTRRFCQVSVFGTVLLAVTVNVTCVEVMVNGITPPLILLLMFFKREAGSPLILIVGIGQHDVSKMNPGAAFRMIVPVPTFPLMLSV